jgi:hypothetical protein
LTCAVRFDATATKGFGGGGVGWHRRVEVQPPQQRARLERRARLLAWGGNAWHFIEFGIAVGAGIAAGSVALIGFGIDSLIESLAAFVIVWLFTGGRGSSAASERWAQRMIAASYFVLVAYIGVEATRDLVGGRIARSTRIRDARPLT